MKVEYDFFLDMPSLIIKGADFIKAFQDRSELFLLEVAIDGFGAKFGVVSHFDDEVNDEIKSQISKTSEVIYTIKERWLGSLLMDTWCEVYISNGGRPKQLVASNDFGRNFGIIRKDALNDE